MESRSVIIQEKLIDEWIIVELFCLLFSRQSHFSLRNFVQFVLRYSGWKPNYMSCVFVLLLEFAFLRAREYWN